MPHENWGEKFDRDQRKAYDEMAKEDFSLKTSYTETARPIDSIQDMATRSYMKAKNYSRGLANVHGNWVVREFAKNFPDAFKRYEVHAGDRLKIDATGAVLSRFEKKQGGFVDYRINFPQKKTVDRDKYIKAGLRVYSTIELVVAAGEPFQEKVLQLYSTAFRNNLFKGNPAAAAKVLTQRFQRRGIDLHLNEGDELSIGPDRATIKRFETGRTDILDLTDENTLNQSKKVESTKVESASRTKRTEIRQEISPMINTLFNLRIKGASIATERLKDTSGKESYLVTAVLEKKDKLGREVEPKTIRLIVRNQGTNDNPDYRLGDASTQKEIAKAKTLAALEKEYIRALIS